MSMPTCSSGSQAEPPLATLPELMKAKFLTPLALALLCAGLSACGGSSASGVQLAPSGGSTTDSVAASATSSASSASSSSVTASSTSSSAAVSTPKPPSPLSKKPVVTVPSGAAPKTLVIKDLIKGTGATATSGKTVTVNYVGVLFKGGTEFDSSWKRSQTFPFQLGQGQVIPGWDKGVPGMKVGGRRELIIPAAEAYGAQGQPPTIPPNAPLVFVIDLLAVS